MDRNEAREILGGVVAEYRRLSYKSLLKLREPSNREVIGPSGTSYQLEIEAIWDDRKRRTLRLMVSIDDGGWRAFAPMTTGFIIAPDGSFVGEAAQGKGPR